MANGYTFVVRGPESIRRIIEALWKLPEGWIVTISQAKRSLEQNKLMWALLSDVSRAKPEGRRLTPKIWKTLFMHKLDHEMRFEMALDGNGMVPIDYSTSSLRKSQMSDLIECIREYGARHGVNFSDPESRTRAA